MNKPKLRTYVTFKTQFKVEPYVLSIMSRGHTSYLAQLRCGILPFHIETGRWNSTDVNDRVCNNGQVEDEIHLIFHCNAYSDTRNELYHDVSRVFPTFLNYCDNEKLGMLFQKEVVCRFGRYVYDIMKYRHKILFNEND